MRELTGKHMLERLAESPDPGGQYRWLDAACDGRKVHLFFGSRTAYRYAQPGHELGDTVPNAVYLPEEGVRTLRDWLTLALGE